MWLFPLFDWFSKNPIAQWVVGIGAALAGAWAIITLRDRRIKKDAVKDIKHSLEKDTFELKEKIDEEEDRVTRELNERSLRELATNHKDNRGPVR